MPKKLLLADDSLTIEKVVRLTFADEDIEIHAAADGDAALRMIGNFKPDIILADVFMPGPNGYEICAAVKENSDLAHIPVILLVGAFEEFNNSEADRVRCNASLTKPFDTNELIQTVKALLHDPETEKSVSGEMRTEHQQTSLGPKTHLVSGRTKQSFLGSNSILDLFGTPYSAMADEPDLSLPEPVIMKARPVQVIPFPGSKTQDAEQAPIAISEEVIDLIVQRVVRQLSQEVIREIAWEVVPELSKTMIRQVITENTDLNRR